MTRIDGSASYHDDAAAATAGAASSTSQVHHFRLTTAVILAAALIWRVSMLIAMPAISRDGVGFCWFARDLGLHGAQVVSDGSYEQHPLYPLMVLGAQRLFAMLGVPESPLAWQRAAQAISLLAGMAVVGAAGWVAGRLTRALGSSKAVARQASWWALLLAAVLPMGIWLSVDAMSDSLHLAFYLLGAALLIDLRSPGSAMCLGLLSGLAFLVRPEGALLVPAGLAALVASAVYRQIRVPRLMICTVALCAGFVLMVGPYWMVLGGISPKLNKERVEEFVSARELHAIQALDFTEVLVATKLPRVDTRDPARPPSNPAPLVREARLDRAQYAWYEAVGFAAYQTFRCGRVTLPLFGLIALVSLRRKLTSSALCGLNVCLSGHFLLTAALALRHGYLDPRHTLVTVMLLSVLAAFVLADWMQRLVAARHRWAGLLLACGCVGPLMLYSLRVPNADDGLLRAAGERLRGLPNFAGSRILVGGSNEKRIAFYADCRFQPWGENSPTPAARLEALRHELFDAAGDFRPAYFAIELTAGARDDAELLAALSTLPQAARNLRPLLELADSAARKKLLLFELRP